MLQPRLTFTMCTFVLEITLPYKIVDINVQYVEVYLNVEIRIARH